MNKKIQLSKKKKKLTIKAEYANQLSAKPGSRGRYMTFWEDFMPKFYVIFAPTHPRIPFLDFGLTWRYSIYSEYITRFSSGNSNPATSPLSSTDA